MDWQTTIKISKLDVARAPTGYQRRRRFRDPREPLIIARNARTEANKAIRMAAHSQRADTAWFPSNCAKLLESIGRLYCSFAAFGSS